MRGVLILGAVLLCLGGCRTVRQTQMLSETARIEVHDTAWMQSGRTVDWRADTVRGYFEADSVRTAAGTVIYSPRAGRVAVSPTLVVHDTVSVGSSVNAQGVQARAESREKRRGYPWSWWWIIGVGALVAVTALIRFLRGRGVASGR